ncbi:NIPSNAP family protein [Paeniroseomonas aquatica]|uniref:NIPSNAP family protein n=1 Tax=Paeniroseomonas aquatica TaxID=373043 RepID=A0ABT8AB14_9PROT|nr:NIPSNAP family protein [Paeniroseomonas aquatica]MDN3566961.1 NIPSNAP family protein [Paeniroseomonas aquatica]
MIEQLRIYEIFEPTRAAFLARFRDHAMRIMARHGFHILAIWESRSEAGPEFSYLLEWPDEPSLRAAWESFLADEEWIGIKRDTPEDQGPMVGMIEDRVLHPVDYSPHL